MEALEFFQYIKILATILHVISVVFGMGAALVSDMLFSFFSKDKKLNSTEISTLNILSTTVLWSLGIITLSGIFIFLSDVEKYLHSAKFLAKMTILAILLINGYVLQKYVWPHLLNQEFFYSQYEQKTRKIAFVCGAVSVISWLSVCTLGVLDRLPFTYSFAISLYVFILCFGGIVSLYIEKKEFN
jgi:hypothetical protein